MASRSDVCPPPSTAGRPRDENGVLWQAHRLVYALTFGPIATNVLHKCDNQPCCNPFHLFVGTQADNMADMKAKGRARGPSALDPDGALQVRRALASGERAYVIARRMGVSRHAIGRIARGERRTP
jgi:hypothetical protein